MELAESIESLNQQLKDLFGIDTINGLPMWRVVWSENMTEKQKDTFSDYTKSGIFIRTITEIREIKKYPWIKEKYVLENLVLVPEISQEQLLGAKISYEPLWVFQDENENYLPPTIEVCKFVIGLVQEAKGKKSHLPKYKEDLEKFTPEGQEAELDKLQKELFGNETDVGDALAYREGIVNPYQKEN